ncbi:MAG: hypothetical protein EYC70_15815 [Planctomycetota bacterium]|nr:MAG: hypothetical protein EYC70_15815 [Planctomycetota bacterium]
MNRLTSHAAALAAACALCAGAASAQTPYVLDEQRNQSNFSFSGDTSIGPILGNPSNDFEVDGIVDILLTPSGGGFSTGEFDGGHLYTVPSTLMAKIPNPFPFLPPLATIDIVDAVYRASSPSFSVNPSTGDFNATVTLSATNGYTEVTYLGITSTTTLIGTQSDPTPVSGRAYISGTQTILDMPIDAAFHIDDPGSGITADVNLDGRIVAASDSASKPLVLRVGTLQASTTGTFTVTDGSPNTFTYLAYSVAGLGDTFVAQLSVTLGIRNPVQAGGAQRTNALGTTIWNLPIPSNAGGLGVRLQAAQFGKASNIWLTTVL